MIVTFCITATDYKQRDCQKKEYILIDASGYILARDLLH